MSIPSISPLTTSSALNRQQRQNDGIHQLLMNQRLEAAIATGASAENMLPQDVPFLNANVNNDANDNHNHNRGPSATTNTNSNNKRRKRQCRFPGCQKTIKSQGHCQRHGAIVKLCKVENCKRQAQGSSKGMCKRHLSESVNQMDGRKKKKKKKRKKSHGENDHSSEEEEEEEEEEIEVIDPATLTSVYDTIIPKSAAWRPGVVSATSTNTQTNTSTNTSTTANHLKNQNGNEMDLHGNEVGADHEQEHLYEHEQEHLYEHEHEHEHEHDTSNNQISHCNQISKEGNVILVSSTNSAPSSTTPKSNTSTAAYDFNMNSDSSNTAAHPTATTTRTSETQSSSSSRTTKATNTKRNEMPLVDFLRNGRNLDPGWHRKAERLIYNPLKPLKSISEQFQPEEKQLILFETMLLSGIVYNSCSTDYDSNSNSNMTNNGPFRIYKDLAHAWGRERGFHNSLVSQMSERRGNLNRKKRSDIGKS
jgi:hypothetical protein